MLNSNFLPALESIAETRTVIFASAFYNSGFSTFDLNKKSKPEIYDYLALRSDYNNKLKRLVKSYENFIFFEASEENAFPVNGHDLLPDNVHKFKSGLFKFF